MPASPFARRGPPDAALRGSKVSKDWQWLNKLDSLVKTRFEEAPAI